MDARYGETTISVQPRCPNLDDHADGLPKPCPNCYSLIQTNVVVPYRPYIPFTTVVE